MKCFYNIGSLLTNAPLATAGKLAHIKEDDLGVVENAWLEVDGSGKVSDFGVMPFPTKRPHQERIDMQQRLVMPGLVDCHTHLIFAGDRSDEFCMRLSGKTYQEIGAAGGGIRSSIKKTRQASDQELSRGTEERIDRLTKLGTTTIEIKTGYGQSPEEEIRQLRLLKKIKEKVPQTISRTLLALHALPEDVDSYQTQLERMSGQLLETVSKENLCEWVDGFVEQGYFSTEQMRAFFEKARSLNLGIRLHADQFTSQGATGMAAELGAASVDHLEFTEDKCIEKMAKYGSVAVLLPGTSLYTDIKYADARPFKKAGVPVALSTDFNPGSCIIDNLAMVASLGAIHCHLEAPEAIAAVTYVAARSLRLEGRKGALGKGYDADFITYDLKDEKQWLASFGKQLPNKVYLKGQAYS